MFGTGSTTRGLCSAGALLAAMVLGAPAAQAQYNFGYGKAKEKEVQRLPNAKAQKIFPSESTWMAVSLNGKPFGGGERPSFILDKQFRAKGFGGCNSFSATAYPLNQQHIAVGPFALTKRTCDKALMEAEQAFFMALRTASVWDLQGTLLVMKGPNGELKFERSL